MRKNGIFNSALVLATAVLIGGCSTPGRGAGKESAMDMYYIVESGKSFDQASEDLQASVAKHDFGVLHVHDLGATLRSKGVDFTEQCRVFEICNPKQASKVMGADMRLNMALPCRISVYTENGKTWIGMIKPQAVLSGLSSDPVLEPVAAEVEEKTMAMIDEAR